MNLDLSTGRRHFEEAFFILGLRAKDIKWEALLSNPRRSIALLRKRYIEPRNSHVDFIEDDSVNGAVTFHNGWALIACNTGTPEVLTTLFTFLLSQPDCLPGIGDETRERRWIQTLAECQWSAGRKSIERQMSVCKAVLDPLPIDETRRRWVPLLSNISLEFFYRHEFAHLVLNHLPLDGRVTREIGEATTNQFYELEADGWAMRSLFADLMRVVGTDNIPTHQVAIAALTIALFYVYVVLDHGTSTISDYRTNHHPHPAVRMSAFLPILDDMTQDDETRAMIADSFATSYMVALQSAETLGIRGASLSFLENGEEIGQEYLRIVNAGTDNANKKNRPTAST